MDETDETDVTDTSSVGERLRAAREEKGFSLEDIAAETRIPRRHLESLESGEWDKLPAPTYSIGFAKSYAGSVGLDRAEISEQLRVEMGGYRTDTATIETFEPVDSARTMPKWLVISAIAAVLLAVILFTWMRERSLSGEQETPPAAVEGPVQPAPAAPQQQAQPTTAQSPVVLSATAPAWIQVRDQGRTLFEGMLNPGQTYQVPPTATAPVLRAGAPEALRINVGNAVAPPVGPAGQVASNVSLRPADLMRAPAAAGQQPATATTP
ncbi:MAG: helix-turn-helix domain-containing protein [Sphingomonas sp.]|nr:helix-turn-helix domain-containing protein [Sphingomonas sp.]